MDARSAARLLEAVRKVRRLFLEGSSLDDDEEEERTDKDSRSVSSDESVESSSDASLTHSLVKESMVSLNSTWLLTAFVLISKDGRPVDVFTIHRLLQNKAERSKTETMLSNGEK